MLVGAGLLLPRRGRRRTAVQDVHDVLNVENLFDTADDLNNPFDDTFLPRP